MYTILITVRGGFIGWGGGGQVFKTNVS